MNCSDFPGRIGMRFVYLPMIALMATAAPAFAGTDDGDTPNPFTAPSAGQTSTSGLVGGTHTAPQTPSVPTGQGGDFGGQQPQPDEAKSSGSFYQQQKKDADGH
jgi:hypothetical protein